ncbi:hypothetical protein LCGC14_0264360 [marine sediment metagenome]|uniref:Uncharacterized protein n=1 Tax=marine sediment metagenome TaxID=412755 RepID=A0A0F9U5J9_9ZZZZ
MEFEKGWFLRQLRSVEENSSRWSNDTTRLKESRNQVHYLRLEKFALQTQLLQANKDILTWASHNRKSLTSVERELEQVNRERLDWKRWLEQTEQQVTALREALEGVRQWRDYPGYGFCWCPTYSGEEVDEHEEPCRAAHKALASTSAPAPETKERCFQIECECSAYHPLGGLCSVCGRDYESNCDHYGKSVPPAYGDGYEQHKFQRALTNETEEALRAGVKAGQEARQRGDVQSSEDVKSEFTNEPLETGTVCPCFGEEVLCIECWAIRKEILRGGIPQTKHSLECTTEGCVDGCIQEGATT